MESLLDSEFVAVVFIAAGLGLGFLELFVPTGGILGIIAFGCCAFGIYGLFRQNHPWIATFSIAGILVAGVFGIRYGLRRISFTGTLETSTSVDEEIAELVGMEGVTCSELRPAGVAQIGGRRIDVVSAGAYIAKGTPVRVVDNSGNRVVVRPIRPASGEPTA